MLTAILALTVFLLCRSLPAQQSGTTLSGTVSDSSGKALPNLKVTAKNLATGQTSETRTDSSGHYSFTNLAPGDYEVSSSAESGGAGPRKVSLAAGAAQTVDL